MKRFSVALFVFFAVLRIAGQERMVFPDVRGHKTVNNSGSEIFRTPPAVVANPALFNKNLDAKMTYLGAVKHATVVSEVEFRRLKEAAAARRSEPGRGEANMVQGSRSLMDPPVVGHNFRGNLRNNSVPLDNTLAISENGFIVSGINTNVIFAQPDGTVTYTSGLQDFFSLLGLGTRMYDPRVIYDPEARRFIFMCLHGSDPTTTQLCIAFSKTEDPNGEWTYYKIDGNPTGDNNWFDYPNIAVSGHDLYIAGLMRNTDGIWQYSVLYQIAKNEGYQGEPLRWKYYNELRNADGQPAFNLVPTPAGWDQLITPGMYFVSNEALGGNKYNLYYATGSLDSNPSIVSMQTSGPATTLAPHGRQLGSSNSLNTFDSRIWSAMYMNGVVHMGSHVNTPSGDVGLFYCKMRTDNLAITADVLTLPGKDLAYPSFTPFDENKDGNNVLVNYLISGPDQFPGQEQRICNEFNGVYQWSEPFLLQAGNSYVDFLQGTEERWGDYTTSCRRFFNGRVESWVTGCFGEGRSYGTWIGQLLNGRDSANVIFSEFVADRTTTGRDSTVKFSDITPVAGNSYLWTFEGGNPLVSTVPNPDVTWSQNGAWDVTLVVTNEWGTDTIVKKDYIHIQDPVVKPVADFIYDRDTIYTGDTVRFSQQCSDNTVTYKWTFQQGTPASSTDPDPVVRYTKVGSFLVSLTAANIAGTSTKIKQKAVTVLPRTKPVALFTADKTQLMTGDSVRFFQQCQGGPTEFKWYFEGGTPTESSLPIPVITYHTPGKYSVSLVATNEAGTDTLDLDDFISVGSSAVTNPDQEGTVISCFPNPVTDGNMYADINTPYKMTMFIKLYDLSGRLHANLYSGPLNAGKSRFSFNTGSLNAGQYMLIFSGQNGYVFRYSFSVM